MSSPIVPTLIDLPSELRGPRVLLRPYRGDEAEQVFAAIDESRDHLGPWVTWVDNNRTVDEVRDYCIRSQANWLLRTELTLGIFDGGSGRYLGGTGLHNLDWELRAFEIGYWLRVSAVGRGYATESTSLLTDFALTCLQARRVALCCDARNDASRRVTERAGFMPEGRLRNASMAPDGSVSDNLVYAVVVGGGGEGAHPEALPADETTEEATAAGRVARHRPGLGRSEERRRSDGDGGKAVDPILPHPGQDINESGSD